MQQTDETLQGERGTYRSFDWVGGGGFGSVFFGRELGSNRPVAIKRLHAHFVHEPRMVARFEREADLVLVRGLRHPNLVRIVDRGRDGQGVPFLVMEWIDGRTVADLLKERGTFAIADAAGVGCQVLQGLEAAHALSIVHRDIKPSNVMVMANGYVKVMDLGIAKETDPEVSSITGAYSAVPATLQYAAPEQLSGDRTVDGRTDLYALGATLYLVLSGQGPFNGPARPDPTPLEQLRPETKGDLAAIVKRALAYEPGNRFPTATDMLTALRPFATPDLKVVMPRAVDEEEVVPAAVIAAEERAPTMATGPRATPTPKARRLPLVPVGAGLLVVVLAIVGVMVALPNLNQPRPSATATALPQATPTLQSVPSVQATATVQITPTVQATPTVQVELVRLAAPTIWPILKQDLSGMTYSGDDAFATWSSTLENGTLKYQLSGKTDASYPVPIGGHDVGQTFHYAVSAKQVSGPPTASYGLIIMYPFGAKAADASTSYYEFVIDSRANARFALRADGDWKTLWQSSGFSAVKPNDTNAFVVHAESVSGGTRFTLFLNGRYVTEVVDNRLVRSGAVGVVMVLDSAGDAAAWEFGNLELRAP